jgi:chromosome segregation ATPase
MTDAQDGTDHVKARDLLRVWLAEDRAMSTQTDGRDPAAARLQEIRVWAHEGELLDRDVRRDVLYLLDQLQSAHARAATLEQQLEQEQQSCAEYIDHLAQRTAERDEAPTVKEGHYSEITDVPTLRRMVRRANDNMADEMKLTDEIRSRLEAAEKERDGWKKLAESRERIMADSLDERDRANERTAAAEARVRALEEQLRIMQYEQS